MIPRGSFVKFVWWSSYLAPALMPDDQGRTVWHEIYPGEQGIVINHREPDYTVVLFTSIDALVNVHESMLEVIK